MRDYRVWLALGGLLLAARLMYPVLAGDPSYKVREEDHPNVVFVCKDSGEAFILRAKKEQETNPRTGQPTLMPGLYCPQCQKWRASPPLNVLQQNPSASFCPTHKVPMTTDGPLPTNPSS